MFARYHHLSLISTQYNTRLPSYLRPTTRECVHLVTRGHFRSHDKDGGHIIRFAVSENSMIYANVMAPYFIEPELLPIEVLHSGNRNFWPFCCCDLDLDQMTFIYKHDSYLLEMYRMWEKFNELCTSRLSTVVRQTCHRNYIPRRFACGQKCNTPRERLHKLTSGKNTVVEQ